jgi:sulfopyruvate decarboxylase subunit alpha
MAEHATVFDAPPVSPARLTDALRAQGYDFFTGVPCSLIAGLISELEGREDAPYYAETREDAAVGLACGAYLGGKQPVVLMQNSGLGVCINALASMTLMYRTPCLLLITWRGYQGNDAPEHIITGAVCDQMLATLGIPYRAPSPDSLLDDLRWATEVQRNDQLPAALLLRAGVTL